jgi:hypothetical protein
MGPSADAQTAEDYTCLGEFAMAPHPWVTSASSLPAGLSLGLRLQTLPNMEPVRFMLPVRPRLRLEHQR